MDDSNVSPEYLCFKLVKKSEDWNRAVKTPISIPIEQIEKKIRKDRSGDASVNEQLKRMSEYRRAQIEDVIKKANEGEVGDSSWDVVHITSRKEFIRGGGTSVPDMEVILARTVKSSRPRAKSTTRKIVDVRRDSPIRKEKRFNDDNISSPHRKEKHYDSDKTERNDHGHGHSRVDSGLAMLSNPLTNPDVFDREGRPMGEHGLVEFTHLPPQIPRDKPLGAPLETKTDKEGKKAGKSPKGEKLAGLDDDIVVLPEGDTLDTDPIILDPVMDTADKHDQRGRRGSSAHRPHDHPEVLYGEHKGSHSHSRQRSHHRGQSRPASFHQSNRSLHDGDLVHFPNHRTRQYLDAGSISSGASDSSHYGYPDYDLESSNTSLGTHGVPRRGGLVHQHSRPDVVYKQHRPGPSHPGPSPSRSLRRASYSSSKPVYYEDIRFSQPIRASYREQPIIYEERPVQLRYERARGGERPRILRQATLPVTIIPEDRQIMYNTTATTSPRDSHSTRGSIRDVIPTSSNRRYSSASTSGLPPLERRTTAPAPIIVQYPHEIDDDLYHRENLDRQSGSIENYQRERIKEEYIKEREEQVHQRERELDLREAEIRSLGRGRAVTVVEGGNGNIHGHGNGYGRSRLRTDPRTGDLYYEDLGR